MLRKWNLIILSVLSVVCLSTLLIGGLYLAQYFYVDCSLNQNVDLSASRYTQIESNNLESIQAENVHRLTQLASARGTNQDLRSYPVFSPDERYLAVGGVSSAKDGSMFNPEACGNIWVWNLKRGNASALRISQEQGKRAVVTFLEFNPDSSVLLSNEYQTTDRRHVARLWNLSDNISEQVNQSFRSNRVTDSKMQFSTDGRLIAYRDENERLRIYSVDEARVVDIFGGQGFLVSQYIFMPNNSKLVFADQGGAIHVWDIRNRREEMVLEALGGNITHLVFNPNKTILASASSGEEAVGVVQIWDIQTGQQIARFTHDSVGLNFDLDGSKLYSISSDRQLEIWDVGCNMKHARIQLEGPVEEGFDQVVLSPDLSLIVARIEDGVQLWNTANGEKLITLSETPDFSPHRIGFSRDGKLMAIVGNDYRNYNHGSSGHSITVVQVWGIPIQE